MILDRIRATLRDPLYRHERRQARFWKALGLWALALLPLGLVATACFVPLSFVCCCVFGSVAGGAPEFLLACLPAFLGIEGIALEREQDTLDQLLLTPVDRLRIVWAKALAWQRPLFWIAAGCVPLGLVAGAAVGAGAPDSGLTVASGAGLGLSAGVLGAILVAGQSLTCGVLGLSAALRGRTRPRAMGLAALMAAALCAVDSLVFGGSSYMLSMLSVHALTVPGDGPFPFELTRGGYEAVIVCFAVGLTLLIFAGRLLVLSGVLPHLVANNAARRMDELLLREG